MTASLHRWNLPLDNPEQFVIVVNAVILAAAYFYVYPRFAGADLQRLAINDLIANTCALLVVGLLYGGTGQQFSLLVGEVGWFGFTIATFLLMELPLFIWYSRRYGLFSRPDDAD